jgi:flagellar basal-body rod modification protein FlgD
VYDLRGHLVRSLLALAYQDAGEHDLSWDGRDDAGAALPSGTYLLRLESGLEVQSLRVSLIR